MVDDIGDIAQVPVEQQEDVDHPHLDAEGGDDREVAQMLMLAYAEPGPLVEEGRLL